LFFSLRNGVGVVGGPVSELCMCKH
jgi:hypothetical protein